MRLSMGKRLLVGVAGLLILLFGVYLLIFGTGLFTPKLDLVALADSMQLWHRLVLIVAALLLCALGVEQLGILFHRRGDKGFVMQHTELGDMSISMDALNTMVHKCVEQHREINVKATKIDRDKDGITIEIRILLETGVNIPLTVNALQKQIKQYITSSSGVDVHTVKVLVETDASKVAPALAAPVKEEVVAACSPVAAHAEGRPVVVEEPKASAQAMEGEPSAVEEVDQPDQLPVQPEDKDTDPPSHELYAMEAAAEATTGEEAALEEVQSPLIAEDEQEEAQE